MAFRIRIIIFWRLFLVFVEAERITLPWCKPPSETPFYEPRVAQVGDTVVFDWEGEAHNAWIYPSAECFDFKEREYLGEQPGASYTFVEKDVGTNKTFVCSLSNHCIKGQLLTFVVVGKDEITLEDYKLSTPCGDGFLGDSPIIENDSAGANSIQSIGFVMVLILFGAILVA